MSRLTPVILSGGSGSRLWPLSRELYPKQLLPLMSPDHTMLQATVQRLAGIADLDRLLVICNEAHRFLVAEQLRAIGETDPAILLEPLARNTAPAVCLAALHALHDDSDALLLVLPADHVIADTAAFQQAVAQGRGDALDGALVTFGIVPTRPETGYGYIRAEVGDGPTRGVAEFVEKPDLETAQGYLAAGGYYWNSGMFLFRAQRFVDELEQFAPEMVSACRGALDGAERDLDFVRLAREPLEPCPSNSIDYAVMERTRNARVVPMDAGWSDVGSWDALQSAGAPDADGNVTVGDVLAHDSRGNYLRAESRLLATVGLEDSVVVETADAVLVARRDRVQDVKAIVERLRAEGRTEPMSHRRVYRPWGSYEGVAEGSRFQVKRIIVQPGASLSLQMHHHRAEHWIIVRGTARVTRGEDTLLLTEDQSTYIPLGTAHRLENPGQIPLELIEVQTGSYLGEDDIVRFDDVYGRR
ncbi:mannose-1-phosphate guanylyltransferase/mannose-6-phosphate isomerase [Natronocella acetinitrilica]|uniref:mannose-1-phosphate guanylyltransferase n=1 Tax=Natronocella acetinitrilica TaxID=414046 RepID=A0AAE3G1I7_9GAMM|nr:mannose-1-phosphate guanylyltransferase/mannose-6-phosphate isomerase [Natronocella acetinitrilica]MCP1673951.1 mannose-1-phosphate guanylyltransferase/mannose-6-phosphate isomerase [Natronocella acetinitrilica]